VTVGDGDITEWYQVSRSTLPFVLLGNNFLEDFLITSLSRVEVKVVIEDLNK
jgi:hypothetical protein